MAQLIHAAMNVYRDHAPDARGRCRQAECVTDGGTRCLPFALADLVLVKADIGRQVWAELDGLHVKGADSAVENGASVTATGPVTVYRANGAVEEYPPGTEISYQPPQPKEADGRQHPHWCAGPPYCRVADGSMTHVSTPEYAANLAVLLLGVDGEPVAVGLVDGDEQVAFRADAVEDVVKTVRRVSRRATTWE